MMTSDRDETRRLDSRLICVLKHALAELDKLHAEQLAPTGINSRELGVMLLIDDRDPESQQQLAARLNVDRTTMVALLDGLEAKKLVERRADVEDRRRNVVELTTEGRAVLEGAVRASDEAERRLLSRLDDAEAVQLRALLASVALHA